MAAESILSAICKLTRCVFRLLSLVSSFVVVVVVVVK